MEMDKDKILEAARSNKERGQEYEHRESTRSQLLGSLAAVIVGSALFVYKYFAEGYISMELIAVAMTSSGVQAIYEGIKVKKRGRIILGIVQSLIALRAILFCLGQVAVK